MPKFDVTKLNVAIDQLLGTTTYPRHRFLLMAYSRHRYLEVAGRYEEIFAPDMMSMDPQYHFSQGGADIVLSGQDHVKSLYRMWAETNQSIFFIEKEEVAVAEAHGADFAVFGPVFEKDGQTNPQGVDFLRRACQRLRRTAAFMPVLALGGITLDNAATCFAAGASGVAAIRLFQQNSAESVVQRLRALFEMRA